MPTNETTKRRPPTIGPPPEHVPANGVRNPARGTVRELDLSLYPDDLFCSQNLYEGETTTIMVSRDPARLRGPHAHYHETEDQFFLPLRGELELDLGAESHTLRPGSLAYIPAGTPHRHRNDGEVDELHLEILAPGFSVMKPIGIIAVDEESEWEAGGAVVHAPADASQWWEPAPGVRVFIMSDPSKGDQVPIPDSRRATIFLNRSQPGAGNSTTHLHRFDQFYYVTEGTLAIDIGLDHYEAGPDSLVVIPAGVPHSNRAVGDVPEAHITLNIPAPTKPSTPDDPFDVRVKLEAVPR